MASPPRGLQRLFRLATGRAAPLEEVDDEIALHLELRTEELISDGLDPVAARRRAAALFGDRRAIAEELRTIDRAADRGRRRSESMRRLAQDLRVACRGLLRQPSFALGGISIVALGIGAATAMFTVLNAAFLKPFAYPESDRLVSLWEISRTGTRMPVAGPNAIDWATEARLFSHLAYYGSNQSVLGSGGESAYIPASVVSRPFAAMLGVAPIVGRWFTEDETRVGAPPVAVIGEGLWTRRFGADRDLVGKTIRLDGIPVTVVGVMPKTLTYPTWAEIWRPAEPHNTGDSRTGHNWRVVARLARGVTPQAAQRELSVVTRRLVANERGGADFIAAGALVVPFREQLIGDGKKVLLLLQGAVLLVLLIAAANLTNLTLARAVRRQNEVGVCLALGARRIDVIRRFASENLVLTLIGGGAGLILAGALRGVLATWVGKMLPFVGELPLDRRVAGFALGLALLVGLGSSIVPAWRASRSIAGFTPSRGTTASRSSRRLIDGLMSVEIALAVMLVAAAGLVGRSLFRLGGVDPGFAVENRMTVSVPLRPLEGSNTPTWESVTLAYDRFQEELAARPGTISVAATNALPLSTWSPNGSAQVEGTPSASGGPPAAAEFHIIGPGFFRTVEVPVRRGREFGEADRAGAPYVAVVNEAFVRKYLGDADPLTQRVRFPGMDSSEDPWAAVVGVVGDTRQDGLAAEPSPAIYYSYRQRHTWRPMTFVVHSSQPAAAVLDDLKAAVARLDPGIPFTGKPWSVIVADSLALPRIRSVLLALFAAIALVLSAAGIAAVVAFAVAQRTREIGLRIAVGAPPGSITRDGVLRTARPVLLGLTAGVLGALVLGKVVRTLLHGIEPNDPLTLATAVLVTIVVAAAAAYVPARRALRVDPLTALRQE
ncbi:MAG: FtsX-like permease family protein [Gemmatimonadales bacterium]|nr:FtsX-like permease family protein [Gemmatimonadales bacterium]